MRRSERIRRILRIREQQEEVARAAWMSAQRAAQARAAEAQAGHARWQAGQDLLRQALAHPDPQQLLWTQSAVDAQSDQALTLGSIARRADHAAEQKRAPWVQARQTVRAMERLYERADRVEQITRREREAREQSEAIEAHMALVNPLDGDATQTPLTTDSHE